MPAHEIEAFAQAIGRTPKTFIRAGYGFTRSRNGAVAMHAVSCIPTVTGAWKHEGGGAFHSNSAIYRWNKRMVEGRDIKGVTSRELDQSRIGDILTGDAEALLGGPPVTAMLIQNTNPVSDRAGPGEGAARLRPRGPVRRRARAVHDRDGAHGRHRAAGDHVHRA